MTTILWDGRHLAVDSRVTVENSIEPGATPKLFRMALKDGTIFYVAMAGSSFVTRDFLRWLLGPCASSDIPRWDGTCYEAFVVIKKPKCPARIFVTYGKALEPISTSTRSSLGSGGMYALVALAAITSKTEGVAEAGECINAVSTAAQFDYRSGGPIAIVNTFTGDCSARVCDVDLDQLTDPFYHFIKDYQ